jgi:hypothetical protein
MRRRRDRAGYVRPLQRVAVAVGLAAITLAGTVSAAAVEDTPRAGAEVWLGAFAERPHVDLGGRMIVVLAAPSLADRMAEAARPLSGADQRRIVRRVDLLQRRILTALRVRGVSIRREHVYARTFNGFAARLDGRAVAALASTPGVVGVYPVRAVYPAELAEEPVSTRDAPLGSSAAGTGRATVALLDGGSHGEAMEAVLRSVAPEVELLPIRVLRRLADGGAGSALAGRSDLLLAGLERAVDPDADGDVDDAVRIALVPLVEPYAAFADGPEARATAGALALGTLVVAPAGNDGPGGDGFGPVAAPGGTPAALAVGAVAPAGEPPAPFGTAPEPDVWRVAPFSSHGPALGAAKPDVVAVGVGPDGAGTSVAAARAAGVAAVVAAARPELDAAALRGLLVGSAQALPEDDPSAQGAGVIDAASALAGQIALEPATLSFGRLGGRERSGMVTALVRNLSDRPLDVRFAVETTAGAEGLAEVTAAPARVSLEPGATARVRFTARLLRPAARPSALAGTLLAVPEGAPSARVPWVVLIAPRGVDLVGELHLSRPAVSRGRPAVLSFRAGWVDDGALGVAIEPVGLLVVELRTAGGKPLGVLARLRDLLPGRYELALTGRGPDGRRLAPGRYVVRLRAHSVDARDGGGGIETVASARFTVRKAGP